MIFLPNCFELLILPTIAKIAKTIKPMPKSIVMQNLYILKRFSISHLLISILSYFFKLNKIKEQIQTTLNSFHCPLNTLKISVFRASLVEALFFNEFSSKINSFLNTI